MTDRPPTAEDGAAYAAWVRSWVVRVAEGTTVLPDGDIRFTPGLVRALHAEVGALTHDDARYIVVAAIMAYAGELMHGEG
jgi:hypothetical protein